MIEELIAKVFPATFFFVGGFRSNEVRTDHPLSIQMADAPTRPLIIHIGNLPLDDIVEFVADTLGKNKKDVIPLSELIYEKTNG